MNQKPLNLETPQPLVSIVVPTKSAERHLEECLRSVREQTYRPIELIVIDNYSEDSTLALATNFADIVQVAGPERSAQVNLGACLASGKYIFRVDADFRLDPNVVMECVALCETGADAVIVHNTADASVGLLARIRKFEVDMYKYSLDHTSARFLSRQLYCAIGGLREDLVAGEDYDFQNRLRKSGATIVTAEAEAIHLDEPVSMLPLIKKYYRYGKDFPNYRRYNKQESRVQLSIIRKDYIRHRKQFILHPVLGVLFVCYHLSKFVAGGLGYASSVVANLWRCDHI